MILIISSHKNVLFNLNLILPHKMRSQAGAMTSSWQLCHLLGRPVWPFLQQQSCFHGHSLPHTLPVSDQSNSYSEPFLVLLALIKGPSHTELERIIWWPHSFHVMVHTHPYDLLHEKIRRHHCAFALESTENLRSSLSQWLRLICPSAVCVTPGSHGTEIVGVMRSCDLSQPIHWILHLLTNCTLLLLSNDSVSWGCTCFFLLF